MSKKTTTGVIGLDIEETSSHVCNCKAADNEENMTVDVYIKRINERNPLPEYKSVQASGIDLYASLGEGEEVIVGPGEMKMIKAGISCVIPDGFEIQIRPRSGLAFKNQVTVLNSPGTIDADYRDELGILLFNHGRKGFAVKNGDRIAQAVLGVAPKMNIIEVDDLRDVSLINRGGGFGSTGEK